MIDVNAYLGHFAFRRLHHNTAAGLLRLMDRKRIERAAVSSAAAITYRNAHAGNEELFEEIGRHRDRLIPFAVLNPAYAGWRDDLAASHEKHGIRGLRLYPRWHNYRLADPECLDLVRAAAQRRLLVSIPMRVEDRRQQSWLVDIPDVDHDEVAALVKAVPEGRFLLLNGSGFSGSVLGRENNGLPANYSVDIARVNPEVYNEMGQLIANLGPERLLFGTGMPFHYPDPALLKLEVLDAPESVKDMIRRGNAARLGL